MTKMKKMLTWCITVAMLAVSLCFPLQASALTEGDWEFQLLDSEVMITGYLGEGGDVVIPDTIYGCPVTSISGYDIFSRVTEITFPMTVTKIPRYLFNNSYSTNKTLKKVVLPEGVQVIEANAFKSCAELTDITLPSTLNEIKGAWYEGAFQGCISLENINFPENITKIGDYAFHGAGLKKVDLSKAAKLEVVGSSAFNQCTNLQAVTFGNGLKEIRNFAFGGCILLKDITFSNNLEHIATYAFSDCDSLETVILPVSLKTMGVRCFIDCSNLREITVPYGVTTIGEGAFQSCENLRSVYIPDTVVRLEGASPTLDSKNAIIYCTADSAMAKFCKTKKISYLTDSSVNSGITVLYNGTRISFHSYGQNPELLNSRTLVPLRSIFEAMSATVTWDAENRTAIATRKGITVKIKIDANAMDKNGMSIPMDVPAQLINDRTMVPVRVIAEAFGADVEWNGNGRTVLINE